MTDFPQRMPGRNIELKARLTSLEAARAVAERLATDYVATEHQVDTYFHCRDGRLKLREINGQHAQLIWYHRPDQQEPRPSDYSLVEIHQADLLKTMLSSAVGVRKVVDKMREIFLFENVRIHLDRVSNLGCFLEFEAVLDKENVAQDGESKVNWLMEQFEISPDQILAGSYCDMI
jgi:adenylate cyclase class 2